MRSNRRSSSLWLHLALWSLLSLISEKKNLWERQLNILISACFRLDYWFGMRPRLVLERRIMRKQTHKEQVLLHCFGCLMILTTDLLRFKYDCCLHFWIYNIVRLVITRYINIADEWQGNQIFLYHINHINYFLHYWNLQWSVLISAVITAKVLSLWSNRESASALLFCYP